MSGISKKMPRGEARPLGTPKRKPLKFVQTSAPAVVMICPRCGESLADGDPGLRECLQCYWVESVSPEPITMPEPITAPEPIAEKNSTGNAETSCNTESVVIDFLQSETPTLVQPTKPIKANKDSKNMKLSLKQGERKGSSVVYTVEGRRGTVKFAAALFADADNAPAEIELPDEGFSEAKRKLSKEEKAALPKLTLEQRAKAAEEKAAKLRAKLAKQNEAALQPAL